MMFKVISSGSIGNCYIMEAENEAIIIECGVTIDKIKKSVDFDISKFKGALISHQHLDHSKSVKSVCDSAIDVYCLKETAESFGFKSHRINIIKETQQFKIGGFKVKAFPLIHDVPTVGYLIDHPESGKVCFITDTKYCKYTFPGLNNIIIEANYCQDIMMERFLNGTLNAVVRARTMESHMSIQETHNFLSANDLSKVNKIVLVHLSSGNADPESFLKRTIAHTGKPVHIAQKGQEIELLINPII